MLPVPTTAHNEALSGDTLYSAFLNYEWRELIVPAIVERLFQVAATIDDEGDRQDFEVRVGALIDDLYDEDAMDFTPVGMVAWFPAPTIPAKWLRCDNAAYTQSAYPDLYDVLVDFQFVDAGVNKFRVPALTDKFLYGATVDGDIGDVGGEYEHTLTVAELPAHTHAEKSNLGVGALEGIGRRTDAISTTVTTATLTGSTGSGDPHNNMPPYMRGYWLIKALP